MIQQSLSEDSQVVRASPGSADGGVQLSDVSDSNFRIFEDGFDAAAVLSLCKCLQRLPLSSSYLHGDVDLDADGV